jgi:hypothetical protein
MLFYILYCPPPPRHECKDLLILGHATHTGLSPSFPVLPGPQKPSQPASPKTSAAQGPFTAAKFFLMATFAATLPATILIIQ